MVRAIEADVGAHMRVRSPVSSWYGRGRAADHARRNGLSQYQKYGPAKPACLSAERIQAVTGEANRVVDASLR